MAGVFTFGEAMCTFFPASGETLTRGVAGAELNVAMHLARLGRPVTYVTRVGDDPFGASIRDELEHAGVEARVTIDPARPTGVMFRELAGGAVRSVFYYRAGSAASALSPDDLPPLDEFELVHVTGITAALSPSCLETVREAARAARLSFDVNFRPALWSSERCRTTLLPLLDAAEVVFVSEEDAAALAPEDVLAAGARSVVHTRGAAGAYWLARDGTCVDAVAPAVEVVDTVGAGDAFAAAFLDAHLGGAGPAVALAAGCSLGAEVVARAGDQL